MSDRDAYPENRDEQGRFRPGASGNPGGRPRKLHEFHAAIDAAHGSAEQVIAVLDVIHARALRGDLQAAKLYLERVMGPARVPSQRSDVDFSDAPEAVLEYLANKFG
jgi:hypothetical protein